MTRLSKPREPKTPKYRSGLERDVAKALRSTQEKFLYEPHKVPYVVHRDYLPDFYHEKSKTYIEVKGFFRPLDTQKYRAVRDSLGKKEELVFLLHDPNKKVRKGTKMNMGEWCTKEGFKFFTLDTIVDMIEYIARRSKRGRMK